MGLVISQRPDMMEEVCVMLVVEIRPLMGVVLRMQFAVERPGTHVNAMHWVPETVEVSQASAQPL